MAGFYWVSFFGCYLLGLVLALALMPRAAIAPFSPHLAATTALVAGIALIAVLRTAKEGGFRLAVPWRASRNMQLAGIPLPLIDASPHLEPPSRSRRRRTAAPAFLAAAKARIVPSCMSALQRASGRVRRFGRAAHRAFRAPAGFITARRLAREGAIRDHPAIAPGRLRCTTRPVIRLDDRSLAFFRLDGRLALDKGIEVDRTILGKLDLPASVALNFDRALIRRAINLGQRLGWRHSGVALLLDVDPRVLRDRDLQQELAAYGADRVVTAPRLILCLACGTDAALPLPPPSMLGKRVDFAAYPARAAGVDLAAMTDAGYSFCVIDAGDMADALPLIEAAPKSGLQVIATGLDDRRAAPLLARLGIALAEGGFAGPAVAVS